jgi:N-dimethylarginine dimethylaminohydrolase
MTTTNTTTPPDPIDADWREHIPRTPGLGGVLMCPPTHFAVVDVKNAFMEGQQGRVDPALAVRQWAELARTYAELGVRVHQLSPEPGCEDMVFCANPITVLPRPSGGADLVRSRMNHPSRQAEVEPVAEWFRSRGHHVSSLPEGIGHLEGHGDVLVVPGRRLALAGHGGRSELSAIQALARLSSMPIEPLALVGTPFYHLDTCLALLDEDTLLVHSPAFLPDALQRLEQLFPRLIEAHPGEALQHLAVNAHALASGDVFLPAQAPNTAARLADAGFKPHPIDLSEFHRSGGSVFCLRLDLPG